MSLIDVLPTVRDAIGAESREADAGVSLLPFARGDAMPNRVLLTMRAQDVDAPGGDKERVEMRGVRKPGSRTVTSAVRGQMRDGATRAEAMSVILGR